MKPFYSRKKISVNSIKESFDNLPSGICFVDNHGIVRLCNLKMFSLCRLLIGRDLQSISELKAAFNNPCNGVQRAGGEEQNVFIFPGGSIWKFSETELKSEIGNLYIQVQASDVTGLYKKRDELNVSNLKLSDAIQRSQWLFEDLDNTIREEEILSMKMKIHDDFGMGLIAARRSLEQDHTLEEIKANSYLWERTISCLKYEANDWQKTSQRELLEKQAQNLCITIVQNTAPPENFDENLFMAAARECLSNCVRHAKADKLYILCSENSVAFMNNGKDPNGRVVEGGGLSALRKMAEGKGYTMKIECEPHFALIISREGVIKDV